MMCDGLCQCSGQLLRLMDAFFHGNVGCHGNAVKRLSQVKPHFEILLGSWIMHLRFTADGFAFFMC